MNTILVPTDFSETANHALEIAVQLTKKYNSRLIVIHMLEIPLSGLPNVKLTNDVHTTDHRGQDDLPEAFFYIKLAEKNFEEMSELPFLKGVNYEEAVQNHLDFKGIIDSAHKHEADLIVMGSHGATGFKEVFVGSHTEKVVRTSDVPVLVIKNRNENFSTNNFVFATNWETDNTQSIIDASKLAQQFGAKMTLLYVNTPGHTFLTSKQIDEKFKELLNNSQLSEKDMITAVYADRSIEEGILNYCNENSVDILGVTTHGRKGLAHFFNHSISEEMANNANIPVVTFKIS